MAKVFVSPGVYTQEIDETFIPANVGGVGAAVVGLTEKGPAFLPIQVGSFGEFREVFGNMDPDMHAPYAARSYLKNANTLNVVRVLGRSTADVGYSCLLAFPHAATGVSADAAVLSAGNTVLGVLRFRSTVEEVYLSGSPSNFSIAIPGKGVTGSQLSLDQSSASYIKKVLGTDPENVRSGDALTALYVDAVFNYSYGGSVTGAVSGASENSMFASCTAGSYQVTGGFAPSETPMIVSQNFGGQVYDLFRVFTRSDGSNTTDDIKISITQVDDSLTSNPTFSLLVRVADDSDTSPEILETFSNLTLNPSDKNYIARVIGDKFPVYDLTQDPPEILYDGDYDNKSQYIRVKVETGYPTQARPSGFKGIDKIIPVPYVPEVPMITTHLNARSEIDNNIFLGLNTGAGSGGVFDRTKTTVTTASGSTSADTGQLYMSASSDLSGSGLLSGYTIVDMLASTSATNFSGTNRLRFTIPIQKGWDGLDPRANKYTSVNDGTLSADYSKAIKILENDDEFDVNLIVTPGAHSSSVGAIPSMAIDACKNRGDSFAIIDLSNGTTTASGLNLSVANAQSEADKYDTNYAAAYYPWVQINDIDNDKLVWVPPSIEVFGAYAFNDRVAQPWYAPAGFTRGGLENARAARRRLTQGQRDDLQERNVNPIATFPGAGLVIWGQQTLQKKSSVLESVNVRRMLLEVRKVIAGLSRLYVFEPNTLGMRSTLLARVNNYLQSVQAARGLQEFRAVLDETTTTPDLIDRNIVKGKIYLKPTHAVEIILLDFSVTKTGAIFDDE